MAGGDSFVLRIVPTSGACAWTSSTRVSTNVQWLTVASPFSGNGAGVLSYAVMSNGTTRSWQGTIAIEWPGGSTYLTVTQSAGRSSMQILSISPPSGGTVSSSALSEFSVTVQVQAQTAGQFNVQSDAFLEVDPDARGARPCVYATSPETRTRTGDSVILTARVFRPEGVEVDGQCSAPFTTNSLTFSCKGRSVVPLCRYPTSFTGCRKAAAGSDA